MSNTDGQGAVVLNMGNLTGNANTNANNSSDNNKKQDTLFGPNIGIVSGGPEWTEISEKPNDELTADIVKGWIAKSKEAAHSTTTLQALVNLKRPTLRLSPLEMAASDDPNHVDSQHHHGLEFEYDCDAPKCGIKVHVVLAPTHHLANKSSLASKPTKLLVFESVTDGGFGNRLKLEEGAMLELGRFEHRAQVDPPLSGSGSSSEKPEEQQVEKAEAPTPPETSTADIAAAASRPRTGLFTNFHLRKRVENDRPVAGPALAVVDAEATEPVAAEGERPKEVKDAETDAGVKVVITLSALDAESKGLKVRNEQSTYLHIVRFGRPPLAIEGAEPEEDNRPWVVKVVKREATIGPHSFHLHEIYGLSSNSNTSTHTTAPTVLPTSYPPTSPLTPLPNTASTEEEPSSECLVCLSSPREVVLLPCRHLVACRECAVNMIEYGAGGQITHNDAVEVTPQTTTTPAPTGAVTPGATDTTAPGDAPQGEEDITANPNTDEVNDGDGNAPGGLETGANGNAPQPTVAPPTTHAPTRRKRKAKGWACPVCRQPYTSLLRITTTAPSKDIHDRDSSDLTVSPETIGSSPATNSNLNGSGAALISGSPGIPPASPRFGFLGRWNRGGGQARQQEALAAERAIAAAV